MDKAKAASSRTRLIRATEGTCASFSTRIAVKLVPKPGATTNHTIHDLHYDLTPSFSSEDVWRGACASRRRDRRLRLLQALVRFAAQAWTRCRSAFLRDVQPRHRARPEPQPTQLKPQTVPNLRMILRLRQGAKPANSTQATPHSQGPTCPGAAIERQSRPSELSRLRSRAKSRY